MKIKTILVNVVTSLGTVLLPRMSFYIEKGEQETFRRIVTKAFRFVIISASSLMFFFIIFARESILAISGAEFLPAVFPMQLLMITLLLIGLSNITGIQILTPMGRENLVLRSILAGAAVDFLLNLVLIPDYASAGAAFATVMAELIVLAVQCFYLRDILIGLMRNINLKKILIALGCACTAGILLHININIQTASIIEALVVLAVEAMVFFGIYGGMLLFLKEPLILEIRDMGLNIIQRKK